MRCRRRIRAFTLAESLLALFLVGLAMGFLGLLFQRSFEILRVVDERERARQAGRMGYDRLSSELREAVEFISFDVGAEFKKINPQTPVAIPPVEPTPVPEASTWMAPDWKSLDAYPEASRMTVLYTAEDEAMFRTVTASGRTSKQLVVEGVNSFVCTPNLDNWGEVEIVISIKENKKIITVSGRILSPCIKEGFK